jgi:hypothetical protein
MRTIDMTHVERRIRAELIAYVADQNGHKVEVTSWQSR